MFSAVVGSVLALGVPALAEEGALYTPLTFRDGIELTAPGQAYQAKVRFRSQNWVILRTDGLDDLDLASVTAQPRRLRLRFGGWVHSPAWVYNLHLGFSRSDLDWDSSGVPSLVRDATIGYKLSPDLQLTFGQSKLPGNRQMLVSSGDQQFPDRSVANRDYTLDRDFGLQFLAAAHPFGMVAQLKLAISGGDGRNPGTGTTGIAYTARVEVLPMGAFTSGGDYFEGDLLREPTPRLSLAGAVHWNRGALRTQGTVGSALAEARDLRSIIADFLFKWRGAAASFEYLRRDCDNPLVKLASGKDGYVLVGSAWNAQASYMLTDQFEAALRATFSTPDPAIAALSHRTQQYAVGLSYYLMRHRVKLQSDLTEEVRTQPGKNQTGAWIARFNTELGI
ncbi:MAG: porin [Deltaproteobacteria bacterium]|nr:porin [Deltaproteobacteria bacterium]